HATVFSDGWHKPAGGERAVVEPPTGDELGRIGVANAEDVGYAASRAREAQRAWAASPYTERAAVLRRAGALIEEHAEEIQSWIIRETGSIVPKAQLETSVAAQECYEAAGLSSHALGEIIPSAEPRMSMV